MTYKQLTVGGMTPDIGLSEQSYRTACMTIHVYRSTVYRQLRIYPEQPSQHAYTTTTKYHMSTLII
ncbi:hypothetical protein Q4488_18780 [Amphritea sp. 1_MG-2023]|uniref:hypothetical protein n=1 Tax=Amphritea sp. 1_MG-2023 TaxID=3062670 RepID=UPI0026E23702|nr:hypothetical protein [Amphritea sp. 1_MG-2023]MDO6565419.1 hypothetical protein [Amphritea sp. 1_MG-2023]